MVLLTEINNRVDSELDEYFEPYLEMKDFSGARICIYVYVQGPYNTHADSYPRISSIKAFTSFLEAQGHEVDEPLLVRLGVPSLRARAKLKKK